MKKAILIAAIVILVICGIFFMRQTNTPSAKNERIITSKESDDQEKTDTQASAEIDNKSNIELVKKYMELVSNTDSQHPKNLYKELKGLLSDELLDKYKTQADGQVDEHQYKTQLKHPVYTTNDTTVMALYTLKTSTDANENEQEYLFVATIKDGKIQTILKDQVLR